MKKITLSIACISLLSLMSCKKDRQCTCTLTSTNASGVTTTELNQVTTYEDIKKGDAKTRCQNYTSVYVNADGKTETNKGECKLN